VITYDQQLVGIAFLSELRFSESRPMLARHSLCLVLMIYWIGIGNAAERSRTEPKQLRGGDHGIGKLAPRTRFRDLDGVTRDLEQLASNSEAVVVAMTSTTHPLSEKYFPTLVNLAQKYSRRDVHFVIVNAVATDAVDSMREAQGQLGRTATYVFDKHGTLASSLGADTNTDAILIDRDRTVVYHGAIDDQHGAGYTRPAPRKNYLADAIEALLANKTPAVEATAAPGRSFERRKARTSRADVTYHNRISRLMNRHCVTCHRDQGPGPFPLDTYADVAAHAAMIYEVVGRRTMPPWFAATNDHSQVSPFVNDASLSSGERNDLLAWLRGDQEMGDASDAPLPLEFSGQWQIGQPDVVYEFPTAIPIKATGVMPYKYVTIETGITEEKWVEAVEVLPGNLSAVHHVLVFAVPPGKRFGDAVNYWAGYVPGNGSRVYLPSYARRLPKNSSLIFQMHYTPNGRATSDKTKIGLRFANSPPHLEVKTGSVVSRRFAIPPRARNHKVQASMRVPEDAKILGFLPHHHLRGVAGRYELVRRGGIETLLDIPDYDFNWQLFYQYGNPRLFKQGWTIRYTAWYDNSVDNPANPNPNTTVRWGSQTSDEMHIGYIEFAVPAGHR
jgi:mono/diheme cytochrome c family protein